MPSPDHSFVKTVDRKQICSLDKLKIAGPIIEDVLRTIHDFIQPCRAAEPTHLGYRSTRIGPIERFPTALRYIESCCMIKAGWQMVQKGGEFRSLSEHQNNI